MRKFLLGAASAVTALTGFGTCDSAFAQPGARPGTGPAAASPLPGGSYQQSCVNAQASGGQLTADCRDIHSRTLRSTLPYSACRGDISNQNGTLSCAGSVASGGQVVDNGGDRRGKSDNTAAAVAAGAVAGALLGGALAGGGNGGPPPPPPAYGDPRYGDPRYDPHYAQGGWGYGHRPGEWVAIRDRADWLNQRIDRAQREGRLGREDARDLRRQLASIEDMEARDMRDGRLDPRERAELDRRFDDLQRRINFESGPPERGPRDRDDFRR